MTNYKANPPGWTDAAPTNGLVSAKQLNTMDRNLAGAVDVDGGIYSPAQELRIADFGTSKLLDSYERGILDRGATGRTRKRIDFSTIVDAPGWQSVDTTYDAWWSNAVQTQVWFIRVVTTSLFGQVPLVNDEIEISILSKGFQVNIAQEDPWSPIASFPAAVVVQAATAPFYLKVRFDGANWGIVDASADVF